MPRLKLKRIRPSPTRLQVPETTDGDTFGQFCIDLRLTLHMTQAQLGEWFAVSGKTFARWEDQYAFPSKLQIPGILAALRTHAPEQVDRASRTLGVELPLPPAAPAAPAASAPAGPAPALAKLALEGALFEAAERLGVPSARVREVAVLLFERATLLGLAVGDAAAMIRAAETAARG